MTGNRDGFTPAEVLVVMLITSVLVRAIHAAYRQAHRLSSRAEDGREAWYLARLRTETLREESCGPYVSPGDDTEERVNVGTAFQLDSMPGETVDLRFFTLTPAWRTDVAASSMARVCCRFDRDR